MEAVLERALNDAEALEAGGVDGILLENFGDVPFCRGAVEPVTVAAMTAIAVEVRKRVKMPIGVNVLRNDARSALSIAAVVGARFVRVNVHTGAMLTDQGIIQGEARETLLLRKALGRDIKILADVHVKHGAPLAPQRIEDVALETIGRGGADALVLSGRATGEAPDPEMVRQVRRAIGSQPLWIGSGINARNAKGYFRWVDGAIVGTSLKQDGRIGQPVDPRRVRRLVESVRRRS